MARTVAKFPVKANAVHRWRRLAGLPCLNALKKRMWEDSKVEMEVCEKLQPMVYNEDFRKEALAHYEKFGQAATCRKFGLANATIYHWLRNGIKSKLKHRYSAETRAQVLQLASKCGGRAAARAFGLNQPLVARWVLLEKEGRGKTEGVIDEEQTLEDTKISPASEEEDEKKIDVMETVKNLGVGDAAKLHKLPLVTVWRWRDEERRARIIEERRLRTEERKRRTSKYSPQLMEEAVEHYMKHGAVKAAEKFNVPRQTLRHWVRRKLKGVPLMGKVIRRRWYASAEWKEEAVALAKKEGVAAASVKYQVSFKHVEFVFQLFQVSRAILYRWEREMRKEDEKNAGDDKEGRKAKSVFFRKEEKVMKKKKCRSKVSKPKSNTKVKKSKRRKKTKKNEWHVTPVLPEWAVNFLKPSKKAESDEKGKVVLASEEMPLLEEESDAVSAQNIFSLTIPVIYHQDEEKEELVSMPRFSPQGVSEGGTVDPPSLVGGVKDCLVEVIVSQL